ncbi:MAG: helix-hairpin-helix domain-containing protein [Pirellula sp.]|jgi:DNA uptake protein ComE-like DNA-binding protein|nr:helix-hairpin-helix domain-containing protein [Pirellula sp.]
MNLVKMICVVSEKTHPRSIKRRAASRSGSILVLSAVLIALFSVIVYTFAVNAGLEARESKAEWNIVRQRLTTESMLELVRATIEQKTGQGKWVGGCRIALMSGESHKIAVQWPNSSRENPRYGFFSESAKLNLNYLASDELPRESAINKLLRTPGLARTTAESIIDYIRASKPVGQRNRVGLADLAELLAVPGVTEERLYGRDWNRDGMIDPREWQLPERIAGLGLGDSSLGWSGYWTVLGGESTLRQDGTKKIAINQSNLALLYDQLIPHVSPEEAQFILAWRLAPATYSDIPSTEDLRSQKMKSQAERESSFQQRLREQVSGASNPEKSFGGVSEERGGIKLGAVQPTRIPSLVSLCQCSVQIAIDGEDRVLVSPFPNNAPDLATWLERWEDLVTLTEEDVDVSRINIQHASLEILMTIDGMTESIAHAIVRARGGIAGMSQERTTVWLLSQGLVTWKQYREIADEITMGGSVVSGIAIGQLERSRTATRIHFVLDHRYGVGRWMYKRELDPIPAFLHVPKSVGQTR